MSTLKKTKITTIVGTRPEIIRLSEIIKRFDLLFEHRLIHSGQNDDPKLNDIFFHELQIRKPDVELRCAGSSLGKFLSSLFLSIEVELMENRPDAVVILGDTNSALSSIVAKRMGIPVYHLEAGNRAFDSNVPEEINRRIVDHTADFNLAYTNNARLNLISEGLHPRRISVIGSPLNEVFLAQMERIKDSTVLNNLGVTRKEYFLVSAHRQENIDDSVRLELLLTTLQALSEKYRQPVIVTAHPRLRDKLRRKVLADNPLIVFHDPFSFVEYNALQINARVVLSDSGSVSEESAILGFPAITIRDSMERPEALESGSIIMSGLSSERVLEAISFIEASGASLNPPLEYFFSDSSRRVANFILSTVHQHEFWSGIRSTGNS